MRYPVENNKELQVEVNDDIFKLLYPNSNNKISEMTNSDKLYIMYLLKQYYLELRSKLGISSDITFGLEIEFDNAHKDFIKEEINNILSENNWIVDKDGTVPNGGEIKSPVLRDEKKSWIDLSKACNVVSNYAYESDLIGGHIHIGMHILGNNPKYWANFAKLWMAYENVIFRFLYGEYISPRSRIKEHARPVSKDLIENLDRINDKSKMQTAFYIMKVLDAGTDFQERRKKSVNFTNVSEIEPYKYDRIEDKNTIEFRCPNGTFNPIIWQNNVNLLVHLFMYAKSENFNEEIIHKRVQQLLEDNIPSNLYKYSYIYTGQSIELADLIFNNNLDKMYFLKQYIKDSNVSSKPSVKSRRFTI